MPARGSDRVGTRDSPVGQSLESAFDLRAVGCLKEQFNRFLQIFSGSLYRIALARDINFGAKADMAVAFALNNGGELLYIHLISSNV
jgi:hypothetical protein